MTVQEGLTQPAGAAAVETPGSPAWWQGRSSDELQAIVHRGVQAGEMFFAAAAEMERRAREIEAARDAEQVVVVKTSRRLGWELKLLFAVIALGALILLLRW